MKLQITLAAARVNAGFTQEEVAKKIFENAGRYAIMQEVIT